MNISKITEDFIEKNPLVKSTLAIGLVNYSALSRLIIEEEKLKNSDFNAVLISCRRIKSKISTKYHGLKGVIDKSKIIVANQMGIPIKSKSVGGNLIKFTISSKEKITEPLCSKLFGLKIKYFNYSEDEIIILADKKESKKITQILDL